MSILAPGAAENPLPDGPRITSGATLATTQVSVQTTAPPTAPQTAPTVRQEAILAGVCLTIGLAVAAGLQRWGNERPAAIERVRAGSPVWPLLVVLMAGLFCWVMIPASFLAQKQAALVAREGKDAKLEVSDLTPGELAILATVPPAAGLVVMLGLGAALRAVGGLDLGFGARRAARGIAVGLLASAAVVPFVFGFMQLVEWVYRWRAYEHPNEHDLLRALGDSTNPFVGAVLIVGATVLAPLFEELFFRGHVQTVLARVMGAGGGEPTVSGGGALAGEPARPKGGTYADRRAAVWGAIVVTSVLFAVIHARWTWPPIFVLSMCLGYAYERTGNLWVPVTIHAAFNTTSTALYLAGAAN